MKTKTGSIILIIVFSLSVLANIFLGYEFITKSDSLNSTQKQLEQSKATVTAAANRMSPQETQIASQNTQIPDLKSQLATVQAGQNSAKAQLSSANLKLDDLLCESSDLHMNYTDNSIIAVKLQAYVSTLSGVRSVSYVIPERLYNNTTSQLYYVTYVSTDGQIYSKRYIVYVSEFGWSKATFDIDGQCWLDAPK